jgi:Fe-Mn family superoxide dismutase
VCQIEKHNLNLFSAARILLVLDVWEHACYLGYKNDRAKYVENFWPAVNWNYVEKRFGKTIT